MDNAPTSVLAGLLIGLLLVIAFSSGTEVAMLAVNRYRIRHRAAQGERSARSLEKLLQTPDQWLGANLVILALASVASSSIATLLAQRVGHPYALPIMIAGLTIVMIVFCELAPKIYAALHPQRVALSAAYIYRALLWLTSPLLWITNRMAYGFLAIFGVRRSGNAAHTLSPDELRTVVAETGTLLPPRHRQMLLSILDLERVTVEDIMIPRQDIAGIDINRSWEDIVDQLRSTPHTRLPVFDGEFDKLVGLLHMKRVAQELARENFDRERLIEVAQARELYFVPQGTSLMLQLTQFQRSRRRLAFVVDEYGSVLGLVTLEDLLEEIVGEFTTDPATLIHRHAHIEASGSYIVNASATIRVLNRSLGWHLPTEGPKTLNGLLLERLERIPDAGTVVQIDDYHFEILQITDNAIKTARVRLTEKSPDELSGG
ncbi:MAG: CNNM domain-containing protein [Steroidobacteraceae bacterium]